MSDEADQLFADPDRLEQVVDNLVANAIRHASDGGHVELRAQLTREGAEIAGRWGQTPVMRWIGVRPR